MKTFKIPYPEGVSVSDQKEWRELWKKQDYALESINRNLTGASLEGRDDCENRARLARLLLVYRKENCKPYIPK